VRELKLQAVMGLFCTTDGVFFLKEITSFCSLKGTTKGEDLVLNVMETVGYLQRDWEKWINNVKGKGKSIPLQASTGPEGSMRLRLPDFKTVGT
jgi:hypothetical protein